MRWYAIKYKWGKQELIHADWEKVVGKVKGKKGVTYKGFNAEGAAQDWLAIPTICNRDKTTAYKTDAIYVFVDGSYSSIRESSGWGWVAVKNDEVIGEEWGVINSLSKDSSRNIVGELMAAQKAAAWADREHIAKIFMVHDYAGIGNWALDYWKAKTSVAKSYKENIHELMKTVRIIFEKCGGHSDIKWNDYADELTRKYQLGEANGVS
jgi:ribonuclease HI